MLSKAGLVLLAMKNWQNIPQRSNKGKNEKANKFEIGLRRYVDRTLNKAIGAFKN